MSRLTWNEYFINVCKLISERSTCLRRRVGALIVRGNVILSTGYNGAAAGLKHCEEVKCLRENIESGKEQHMCRAVHAEENAILQAAKNGISVNRATLYCTHKPCISCSKHIINAGITKILFLENYPDEIGANMLKEADIECFKIELYKEVADD